MARQELLPHQEGCAASVERALKYVPGLRPLIEPAFRAEMKALGIPENYSEMSRRDAADTLYVLECCAKTALGVRFQLFPCLKTNWERFS
jgi:hypothetical protein